MELIPTGGVVVNECCFKIIGALMTSCKADVIFCLASEELCWTIPLWRYWGPLKMLSYQRICDAVSEFGSTRYISYIGHNIDILYSQPLLNKVEVMKRSVQLIIFA